VKHEVIPKLWTYIKLKHLDDVIQCYVEIENAFVGSVHDNLDKHESKLLMTYE